MLSGETASGKYPVETVKMMSSIILEAEKSPKTRPFLRDVDLSNVSASIMVAASMIAEKAEAKAILAVTESGQSLAKLSSFRPRSFVYGITNSIHTVRRMALYWGVTPYLLKDYDEDNFNFRAHIIDRFKQRFSLVNGDKLVITRGDGRFFSTGASNSVKVEIIKDEPKVLGGNDSLSEASDSKKKSF